MKVCLHNYGNNLNLLNIYKLIIKNIAINAKKLPMVAIINLNDISVLLKLSILQSLNI